MLDSDVAKLAAVVSALREAVTPARLIDRHALHQSSELTGQRFIEALQVHGYEVRRLVKSPTLI
jgi:hypothetical protein